MDDRQLAMSAQTQLRKADRGFSSQGSKRK